MIHVVAGVLRNAAGQILIAQRPAASHLGGFWEFPGGKLESGEAARDGLARELREELGIVVVDAEPLIRYRHCHDGRDVLLDVWTVTRFGGQPRGVEGQPLRWVAPELLHKAGILEADQPILALLRPSAPPAGASPER